MKIPSLWLRKHRGESMIRCHLARLMGERKMRISNVMRETGLSRTTVTLLYKETALKVDLEALDKLCDLFKKTLFAESVHPTARQVAKK